MPTNYISTLQTPPPPEKFRQSRQLIDDHDVNHRSRCLFELRLIRCSLASDSRCTRVSGFLVKLHGYLRTRDGAEAVNWG